MCPSWTHSFTGSWRPGNCPRSALGPFRRRLLTGGPVLALLEAPGLPLYMLCILYLLCILYVSPAQAPEISASAARVLSGGLPLCGAGSPSFPPGNAGVNPALSFPGPADLRPCFPSSGDVSANPAQAPPVPWRPPSSGTKVAAALRQRAPGRGSRAGRGPSWRRPGPPGRPRRPGNCPRSALGPFRRRPLTGGPVLAVLEAPVLKETQRAHQSAGPSGILPAPRTKAAWPRPAPPVPGGLLRWCRPPGSRTKGAAALRQRAPGRGSRARRGPSRRRPGPPGCPAARELSPVGAGPVPAASADRRACPGLAGGPGASLVHVVYLVPLVPLVPLVHLVRISRPGPGDLRVGGAGPFWRPPPVRGRKPIFPAWKCRGQPGAFVSRPG